MDFSNPENWQIIYNQELTYAEGLPLLPVVPEGSFDARFLRVFVKNDYAANNWTFGASLDLMVPDAVPATRFLRFSCPINEAVLIPVPDWIELYRIRCILPSWFRCVELKIESFGSPIAESRNFFGSYEPTEVYDFPLEIGTPFEISGNGEITALRFHKPDGETGDHVLKLWNLNGDLLASAAIANAPIGWNEVPLDEPYPVVSGNSFMVSVNANTRFSITYNANPINPDLTNPVQMPNGDNGRYTMSLGSFPTSGSGDGSWYFTDLVFVPG